MSYLADQEFQRICIVKPSALGDIIHALPVLNGLRQRYPGARISWIVNTEYVDLLEGHPQLDEVIPFDRQRFRTLWGTIHMTFKLRGYAAMLRRRDFDLVIDLQGLFRSGVLTYATGSALRLGFSPAREGAGLFYNHRIIVHDPNMHAVDKNYLVSGLLGFDELPVEFKLPVREPARRRVQQLLNDRGLPAGQGYVLVLPGSRWETKNWWPDRYSRAIDTVTGELNWPVVISGANADRDLGRLISQACQHRPIQLIGETSLAELIALVADSSLVLCNDSAALHVAVALGKPVVTIFGPTNPQRTGPYGRPEDVFAADLPCSPCYIRNLSRCPVSHECMNLIQPSAVLRAVAAKIGKCHCRPAAMPP